MQYDLEQHVTGCGAVFEDLCGISFDRYEKGKYILCRATVNKIIDLLN